MLGTAIALAAKEFENVTDKGGKPYILHCLYVMNQVEHLGTEAQIAAVLHDIIEDTSYDEPGLIALGFNERTVKRVGMLTHLPNEPYMDYIKRVSIDKITRHIKMADLHHNSDITRMKGLREKDHKRIVKYFEAYAYLMEAEERDQRKS